jgi:hypothetical protein
MAHWCLAQSVNVIRGRHWKTTLDDHSVALTCPAMTDRAVNLEPLTTALENLPSDRHRKCGYQVRADLAGVEGFVFIQLAARNRVGHNRARSHVIILKKIVPAERFACGLIEHIAAAGGGEQQQGTDRECR